MKLKSKSTFDVVCAAVIGPVTQPQTIIAGLPVDGRLRIVGRSSLNRFSTDKGMIHLTLVEPMVVQIPADVAWTGRSFRHSVACLRAKPELDAAAVELPPHVHPGSLHASRGGDDSRNP
ncbi:hypothetical protein J2Y41_001009 [Arthrobacter sp. 1088]|uniref:hypothetical protein n=1 Tax=Arthrobacter sp. 1088 TaxID=2817768 RepID=UPI0028631B8F|nr:hypothetical protein [Arthrobacter sp. 1088]MDR6685456.1 hypothetical protein [Arthrobacter sp. 1088]